MKRLVALVLFVFFLINGLQAKEKMDFELYNLGNSAKGRSDFKSMTRQFSSVIAPAFFGEAESRGVEAVEIGVGYHFTKINSGNDYWVNSLNDRPDAVGVPSFYSGVDIHVKKGLPYGVLLYSNMRYLLMSEMISGGFGMKVAVCDGFEKIPDISLGAGYNRLFGSTDLNMSQYELRTSVGKTFPVASGELKIAPSLSYSMLFNKASSERLGGFYDMSNEDLYGDSYYSDRTGDPFYFEEEKFNISRIALDVKIFRGSFAFSVETIIPFNTDGAFNLGSAISFVF